MLFKVANELLDKKQEQILPIHADAKELADEFNNYYIDKIKKIRQSIPTDSIVPECCKRKFEGALLTDFSPTNENEINDVLKKSGLKTSAEDPIPSKVLKSLLETSIEMWKVLINKSFEEGTFDGVKCSVIEPLLKKQDLDPEIRKNYRPVSKLPFFSKLTERLVLRRLESHMDEHALHEDSQFGYKQHHSTETMMRGMMDEILKGFDENKATIIIFLDLSAAFDTIDFDKVLEILREEIGITGRALEWFRSFLTGRRQCVKIGDQYSDYLEVMYGAPQGSVLGPKLFSLNVGSQPLVFKKCLYATSSFADDSNGRKQFALSFQYNVLKHDIVKCMNLIVKWNDALFMKINPDKTELMLCRPPSLNSEVIINGMIYDDQCIRFSDSVKNVGVNLDCNLTLDNHVNKVTSHSYKILRDVSQIKKFLSKERLQTLVHAIVTSRLDYCNSLFTGLTKNNIRKLQKVQNRAASLICGLRKGDSV